MNTPNKLTVARMILVPFLVVFLLTGWGGEANRWICLAIFVAASVTDWFDGHLARKYNLITNLEIYGSAGRQAFGMLCHDLHDRG